ncbi:NAD(P)-dependent oxidoreductase [Polynucleobacter sp. AP-Elch-400A-B2]|uniref:NAD-dependent epimerase/dehydratase family protein n=1 Tax=Polynucleobacter sp. AP-Elch-400A-B2 TaxID=2576930 RepID=UPI001BFE6E2D|nr:NAD(P)-dependent oxidoreductase [Polynucleobacter sp. AP-Elch-400A-B2]QWE24980.1 NAD(P)-dependent oxidoreductase [Polynucleobacter sp. AP-Elch-400A-B2]
MKILLTGGSGFLGGELVRAFAKGADELAVLVRKTSNLEALSRDVSKLSIYRFEEADEIYEVVWGFKPDIVIHTACCYGRKNEVLPTLINANIEFGAIILDSLKEIGNASIFINIGSALPSDHSLYARTKNFFSEWGKQYVAEVTSDLAFIDLKFQHIYGPGDDNQKFVSYLIGACLSDRGELPLTAGDQVRDFIYIDDAISAIMAVIENRHKFSPYALIEVGSGLGLTIKDLAENIRKLTQSKINLKFGFHPYRKNEVMNCVADIATLKSLGWMPMHTIESGISKILDMKK